MLSTCNSQLDGILFSKPSKIVVYGIAGSGKTNFLLNILKCSKISNENIVYISTEDPVFINRAIELGLESSNFYFASALSQEHLISLILDSMQFNVITIIVDSINHLYRVESEKDYASKLFVDILVLLDSLNKKGIAIITSAQVKLEENIIAGYEYLNIWADKIIEIKVLPNKTRTIRIIKPAISHEIPFVITSKGIEWLYKT
ncbi:MAG: hypothetical protein QW632_01150 [Ignisphaera sp.]